MMDAAHPIGFIGLGTMGEAMALALVKAGTRLLIWNRTLVGRDFAVQVTIAAVLKAIEARSDAE